MDIRITAGPRGGSIRAIPSKSAAHRILIAGALSGLDLAPYCDDLSQDITATKRCLLQMADAREKRRKDPVSAAEGSGVPLQMDCGESGSTLRFLVPLAGVLGIETDFRCHGRLPDRPMEPFLSVLAEHGCRVSGHNPKKLQGCLQGGDYRLPGDISSQYVTGLLMALPLAEEDSRIIIEGRLQSRPYVDMTLQTLAKAGIKVTERREHADPDGSMRNSARNTENSGKGGSVRTVFELRGRQAYRLPESELAQIEGDWSNAAFWLVMDAMLRDRKGENSTEAETSPDMGDLHEAAGRPNAGDAHEAAAGPDAGVVSDAGTPPHAGEFGRIIRCRGLEAASMQGDKAILSVIDRIRSADLLLQRTNSTDRPAGSASGNQDGRAWDISVSGRGSFVEIDASDIPDLVPIMAALACGRPAGAVTHITGAGRLRIKESDRLRTVTETLQALGARITEEAEGLLIRGSDRLYGGVVSSCGDHRIAMMAASAACITEGEILLKDAEAVNKSYPGFFEDYRSLGGQWMELNC